LLLKIFGVRFIFDQHDLGPELFEAKFGNRRRLFHGLVRWAERCSFRAANVCIATNESFKEIAVTRGGKHPENVFVVRNCPDLASFGGQENQPGTKYGKSLLVAYVGFMGKQDGLDLLVESIEHIVKKENRQDTHFVLVGGGSVLPELRATIAKETTGLVCNFDGPGASRRSSDVSLQCGLGVAPDPKNPMNDNSTMIKIFEYMAFRLPIVQYDLKEGRRIGGSRISVRHA